MKLDFTSMHEKMIQENETRSIKNKDIIDRLEQADIKLFAQITSVCEKVSSLTKVLWWLGTSIFAVLIVAIVSYVLGIIGLI